MSRHTPTPQSGAEPRAPRPYRQRDLERLTLAGLLVTALLVGLATLWPMYRQLCAEIDQRTVFDARLLALSTDHLLDRFESTVSQLGSRSEIRNALKRYDDDEMTLDELQGFSGPRLRDALAHAPEITGLVRLDARDQPVLALGKPIPSALWPIPAVSTQQPELSAPLSLDGQNLLLIGSPILSREGRRLGTDIVAFRLDRLGSRLNTIPLPPAVHSHLVHLGSGRVMHVQPLAPGLNEAPENCPLRQLLPEVREGLNGARALPLAGDGHEVAFLDRLDKHPDWAIALLADRDRLYAAARAELLWPLLGILLLTACGSLLTWRLIRPLSQCLEAQAQELQLAASVFDSSNEGIVLMTPEQRVVALNPAARHLTGYNEASLADRPFGSLVLPASGEAFEVLLARVAESGHWQGETVIRRADGSLLQAGVSLAAIYDEARNVHHFMAAFSDISRLKAAEKRVHRMAYYDTLTGLPNRVLAQDRLQQALLKTQRTGSHVAVLFLDLDHFKQVNDSLGHAAGDHLLQATAQRLSDTVRSSDTVARLGGDEFLVLLEDLPSPQSAAQVAAKLVAALRSSFQVDGHEVHIGSSIGIALYPEHGEEAADLVRHADTAMYRAKEGGRNRYEIYNGQQAAAPKP